MLHNENQLGKKERSLTSAFIRAVLFVGLRRSRRSNKAFMV